jgi:hypothetical protein
MGSRPTNTRLPATLLALALPGAAAAVQINYEAGIGIEHDDNVNLSEDHPVADNILIPSLGFTVSQLGSTVQAEAIGVVDYRDYLDNTFGDEFRGEFTGRLNWNVVPERLDLVMQDRLALEPVNTLEPDAPSNLQQTNVIALGPIMKFRLAPTVRGQAELIYVNSHAQESDQFNSSRVAGAVRAIKDLDPTSSISANLADERVTFDDSTASPDYNHYGVYARYLRKWAKVDVVFDLGYSWVKYSGSSGDFDRDSPLLRSHTTWQFAPLDSISLELVHQFSDAASDMLTDLSLPPAEGTGGKPVIPTDIAAGNATITSAPYLEKSVGLDYAHRSERWDLHLNPYYRKYDYGAVTFADLGAIDQSAKGATIGLAYRIAPLVTTGLTATFENLSYDTISRSDRNRYYTLYLRHQWARHWSWRADFTRNERHSSDEGISSDENLVFVGLTYTR